MIDKSNEIFTLVSKELKKKYPKIKIIGESIDIATEFPTVTIDEISNLPKHRDSSVLNKYALITYRVQVFCSGDKKRSTSRDIYDIIDKTLQNINLNCVSFTTTPKIYNSKIYEITSSFEGIIKEDGYIFRT